MSEVKPGKEADRLWLSAKGYSSKIIKAGALLPDTKTLLSHWDSTETGQDNLGRIRRENVFGKASRSRVEDILAIFRQRYLADERGHSRPSSCWSRSGSPPPALDRILYFHAAQADRLLHDVVTEWLVPLAGPGDHRHRRGRGPAAPLEVGQRGQDAAANGRRTRLGRVAQGLLSTLRDFGVLQGAVRKRIAPAYLPVDGVRLRHVLPQAAPALGGQAGRAPRLEAVLPAP